MKKLITPIAILLLAFSLSTNAFAQTWGYAQYGHWAHDVTAGPDGNYWASGLAGDMADWSDVSGGYVVKLDANGEVIFTYNPFALADGAYAQSVLPTEGGGAGVFYSGGLSAIRIDKFDNTGTIEWTSDGWATDYFMYSGQAVALADGIFCN